MLRRCPKPVATSHAWLVVDALEDMLDEAAGRAPLETGGVLLGYVSPRGEPEHVVVEAVLGPGPRARHSKTQFEPDSRWQEGEIAQRYELSGRITTYLGDWHTHPMGPPLPSRRDRQTARAIAQKKSARMPRPLMLILGFDPEDGWSFVVYRWHRGRLHAIDSTLVDG